MVLKKFWPLLAWIVVTAAVAGILTYRLNGPDRRIFLPGETSHGHYQIELACNACHTPWMGVNEKACYDCHAAELQAANDSHPKSKFTDPRNVDRLKLVQADDCITCHREHVPEQTRPIGVTIPDDYCYQCHQQTLTDRPSHKGFGYNSCATAGCHNYHDNTALYETFLLKHAGEPNVKSPATRPERAILAILEDNPTKRKTLTPVDADAPTNVNYERVVLDEWADSAHARAGVNCTACHYTGEQTARKWSKAVDHASCRSCHKEEVDGFLAGMHGMRLAQGLGPMSSAMARRPMKPTAAHRELNCSSCHDAHTANTRVAAVESCLTCHNDSHSLAYKQSAHFALWQEELSGKGAPGTGVSCATCHLPRERRGTDGENRVRVQHNQNLNLRPNEKMIRTVCLDCHGLAFSINALADNKLIQTNFTGSPTIHIESIDLAVRRQVEAQKSKTKPKP